MSLLSLDRYFTTKSVDDRYGKKTEVKELNGLKVGIHAALALVGLITLLTMWPFSTVPVGSRGVITQFGSIQRIQQEGLVVLPPWQKLSLFSIRAETAEIKGAVGGTSDQQPVTTSLVVRYSIRPDKVAEVFEKYSHDGNLASYVDSATHETFKAVTAKFTAPDLLNKRSQVSAEVKTLLETKLDLYGAQVINIDMTDFKYDDGYQKTINDKVKQDQLLQTAEKQLLTVAAEQKQKVAIAEANASAVKAKADGDKYATIASAQADAEQTRLNAVAQAESIRVQSAALASQGQGILELKRINVEQTRAEKWDGKLPEAIYAGAPIPFLNTGPAK